ncbi:hypothetical protein MTP99_015901 [Tenebrio molitor]|nr:hypothetical protein MTP99_015901 [Tenebrio molitor]
MPRAPVPFCGCGGTPHGRGSFAERTVSGGRLSGRGKRGSKTNRCRNKGAFIYTMYKKGGVGTWWRRNLSGTVSVTWRSVPGGCRRRARLVLTVFPVGPGRCWLFLFRSDLDAASDFGARERRVQGKRDGRGSLTAGRNGPGRKEKAGRPGFPRYGRERARKKGESGKAGVPSQWEGTGQGESGKAGVPSQWEGTSQEEMGKAGKPGFPRNGRERARKKWGKRESRGSLAMGGNGPGRNGESGKAGVPSQWEGTGQEELEKAGKPGFPRNGRERARKNWRKRESRGSLAMGRNGPRRKEKAGGRLGRKRSRSRFGS